MDYSLIHPENTESILGQLTFYVKDRCQIYLCPHNFQLWMFSIYITQVESDLFSMGKLLGCSTLSMASECSRRSLQIPSTVLNWFLQLKKPKKRGQMMTMDGSEKDGSARSVKLVFTKEEATKLLAMYVRGQDAMMLDVIAINIKRKEAKERSGSGGWKPALESIPEDWCHGRQGESA